MKVFFRILAICALCVSGLVSVSCGSRQDKIDLAGKWRFALDPEDVGVAEQWYASTFDQTVNLPGSLQEQGQGYDIDTLTEWTGQIVDRSWFTDDKYAKYREKGNVKVPFWLNPDKHYVGVAWYQRDVDLPDDWNGRPLLLELERAHWATSLYVDGKPLGDNNTLQTPHRFMIDSLAPGRHTITLRIDNRLQVNVGNNAHSVTDHTQSNWNGAVGALTLSALPTRHITKVETYPSVETGDVSIRVYTAGAADVPSQLALKVKDRNGRTVASSSGITVADGERTDLSVHIDNHELWDEHSPAFYDLEVEMSDGSTDQRSTSRFGFRDFKADSTWFSINGRPVFLRGTLECCVFPETGYPAMDTGYWTKIYSKCREYGLNHVRFHSWCPPEAAFLAADSMGIYLQVECGGWTTIGSGGAQDAWLREEGDRILAEYGNHPSFVMMEYGNEPNGPKMGEYMTGLLDHWKSTDSRRVYAGSAGWPYLPAGDYFNTITPRIQGWGAGLESVINSCPPSTDFDFRDMIVADMPSVGHEVGQWCVYPDFDEIGKYTGVLKAKNLEIFRETLAENGMADMARRFLYASGRLQTLCYKADIEAALRTPGFGGFQLLGLNDFPGQGTALVGVLDAHWDDKGYVDGHEFRSFCDTTVVLARFPKMVWSNGDTLRVPLEVAHFGSHPIENATVRWNITGTSGDTLASGHTTGRIGFGNCQEIGEIMCDLSSVTGPQQYKVSADVDGHDNPNSWNIWVYPAVEQQPSAAVHIAESLDAAALARLEEGGDVLLLPYGKIADGRGAEIATGFSSIFWNTAWTAGQAPHTLGITCDPAHPALALFPNTGVSDWQWWDMMSRCQAMVIDGFPQELNPIVRIVDDWFQNRSLAMVYEAKVGNGRLLVCSADLSSDLSRRPAAAQLRRSLLHYMQSPDFNPSTTLDPSTIRMVSGEAGAV